MGHVHWWLIALAFVLGLVLTFALMIRGVKREVPVSASTAVASAGAAPSAPAAGAAAESKADESKAAESGSESAATNVPTEPDEP